MSKQSVQAYPSEKIETYPWVATTVKGPTDLELGEQLVEFGLDPHEVELLMLRCVDGKSVKEICEEHGWVSRDSVNHYFRKAIKKLRLRGFRFK